MRKKYYVTTWDTEKQDFTPQQGVRTGPYSQFGLRKALKMLRDLGYNASRCDSSVYVHCPVAVEESVQELIKAGLLVRTNGKS